ncbi:MAG: FMN-binding protein [Clostridia bacterium]|nr:FMN-binding protein [Clostridia bacterium]
MKKYIKSIISLTVICAVIAALLAVTNSKTAPIIDKNQKAAANKALLEVLPDGGDFTAVDLAKYTLPESVQEAYTASNGGCVVKLTAKGYGPDMIIMCGVDANGVVTGAVCLSSNETLGVEKTYGETTKGATVGSIDDLATVSGATMTTGAYKGAVKDALNTAIILGGGSADIRTEEEILADNLKAVLPIGEGKFTEVFISEKLENVSAIYKSDNDAGYVYVTKVGEEEIFVGVDANGVVVSEVADDVKANIEANAKIMLKSSLKEVDISKYADMPKHIDKAYKTTNGNYVIELHTAGYGINGDKYTSSGEYIYIKVALTDKGEIINCVTVKQSETDGVGSICADKDFSAQYIGKDENTYKEIDTVAGVTLTTKGYQSGIGKAIEAVKIMEGVA